MGKFSLPNVKAQRRSGLARYVQLGAHAVTSHSVRCSAWFGGIVFGFWLQRYSFALVRLDGIHLISKTSVEV